MELSLPQIWLIIGLIMLLAELVSVTLVFVFIAIGALLTALLAEMGLITELPAQLITCSVLSIISMLLLRQKAKEWVSKNGKQGEYIEYAGESAMVIKDIPAIGEGRIFYRGAEWIAVSQNKEPIAAGSKVTIDHAEGIRLFVVEG